MFFSPSYTHIPPLQLYRCMPDVAASHPTQLFEPGGNRPRLIGNPILDGGGERTSSNRFSTRPEVVYVRVLYYYIRGRRLHVL